MKAHAIGIPVLLSKMAKFRKTANVFSCLGMTVLLLTSPKCSLPSSPHCKPSGNSRRNLGSLARVKTYV